MGVGASVIDNEYQLCVLCSELDSEYVEYLQNYIPENEEFNIKRTYLRQLYEALGQEFVDKGLNFDSSKLEMCRLYQGMIPPMTPREVEATVAYEYSMLKKAVLQKKDLVQAYKRFMKMTSQQDYYRFFRRSKQLTLTPSLSNMETYIQSLPSDYRVLFKFLYRNDVDDN